MDELGGWWPEQSYTMYQPAQSCFLSSDQYGDELAQSREKDASLNIESKLKDFETGMELRMHNVEETVKTIQIGSVYRMSA